MARNRITQSTRNSPLNQPAQGVARFNEGPARAKSVPQAAPIRFTAGENYMEQMNAIADLGVGIFNATAKVKMASEVAKNAEKDAYLASIESSDIIETNRIYNENTLTGNNPEELAVKLREYKAGKMASMSEEIKPHYSQSYDKRAAVLTTRSQDAFFKKTKKDSGASLESSQEIIKNDIYQNPSPNTEIETLHFQEKIAKFSAILNSRVSQGFLTPEEALLEQKDFQKELIVIGYKSQMENMNADQRANAILTLQKTKTLPNGISVDDKADIVAKLNAYDSTTTSVEDKALAVKTADIELSQSREASDLEIGVNRDDKTYEDVIRAEQEGTITPAKKVQLFKTLDANKAETVKEGKSLVKVAKALRGEAFIDPESPEDKKAVDLTYTKVLSEKIDATDDPAAKKQIITNFIAKMRVVPKTLQGEMRGVFRGDNVEKKIYYADLIGRIQDTTPRALDDFNDKDITQAVMINEIIKAGTPNEQAVEKVQNITEGINAGRLEILKADFKELVGGKGTGVTINSRKVIDQVKDVFGEGVFTFNPSSGDSQLGVESHAVKEYKDLYETWFLNTNGNADLAREQAQKAIKRNWGVTGVNSKSRQLTKYPIEDQYPGMPAKVIKAELMVDIKKIEAFKDTDPDDVFIQWDPRITAREAGKYPRYRIIAFNKEGVLDPVIFEGKDNLWKPDYIGYKTKTAAANLKDNTDYRAIRGPARKGGL